MNWSEYKELSEKTLSTEFHCSKQDELLLHAVIGVITELEELVGWGQDEVNKKEEVADCFWYMTILDRILDLKFTLPSIEKNYLQVTNDTLIIESYKQSSLLLDFLKKKLFYNKPIDLEKFSKISTDLFETLLVFCNVNNINVEEILDTNIAKLKSRYGDKFSSDKAINRDLQTERAILEK